MIVVPSDSKKGIRYRGLTPQDLGGASALIERVFREDFDLPLAERIASEVETAGALFDPSRDIFEAAEIDGRLAGALLVTHEESAPPDSVRFAWFAVEAAARGRGIGRELLFRGIETCRQRRLVSLRTWCFSVSSAAPRLYWMFGFRVADVIPVTVAGRQRETIVFDKRLTPPPAGT